MAQTVSTELMECIAREVIEALPDPFRSRTLDIVLQVADFATDEQLSSVGLCDRWELTGLYEGRPLPKQSQWYSGELPPRIWLFRMPLIAEMRATRVRMEDLIRHVVVHEAGHHFGLSDEDMHTLESQSPG